MKKCLAVLGRLLLAEDGSAFPVVFVGCAQEVSLESLVQALLRRQPHMFSKLTYHLQSSFMCSSSRESRRATHHFGVLPLRFTFGVELYAGCVRAAGGSLGCDRSEA